MAKTYEEINEKIRTGKAVVVTAEEIIHIVKEKGAKKAAEAVDVVTTATFGPMCSSGALLNTGHTKPRMNYKHAKLNDVPAYCGIAAVDLYIGATEIPEDDPANKVFPGKFSYGGGHVIEDLIAGKDVVFSATSYGTHCYPRKELKTKINIKDLNSATLLNPRNAYQNYNVAVNLHSKKPIYTYMGILRPNMGNANFCSAGQLSPLMNDPYYRTIGIGTRIFLGGGVGYVIFQGTQHSPLGPRTDKGIPKGGSGTLAVMGDMKGMNPKYVRGVSMTGYGPSLAVGIGIPIPILDEEMAQFCAISDADIMAPVWDYSDDYPELKGEPIAYVSYAELRSGKVQILGKIIETSALSSIAMAREIADSLKIWITEGKMLLSAPVEKLPGVDSGLGFHPLVERTVDDHKKRPVR
ncbi:MAG: homocysteine biosynthesis protein [Candidatus Riflebacteria bacterium]|nr:homocysteine biosynthesis protein [Candidatus Riflebacteria bacterium]